MTLSAERPKSPRASRKPAAKKSTAETPTVLELRWDLNELPTSQHRAGLAGLVLMVRWLKRQPSHAGICEIVELTDTSASLRIDRDGLGALFDEAYRSVLIEEEAPRPRKNPRTKEEVPYLRTEHREDLDAKTGKLKSTTVYIYPGVLVDGAWIGDVDPTNSNAECAYLKLWRDMLWTIIRGNPQTRIPFKARADGLPSTDVDETWQTLIDPSARVSQRGHYLVGVGVEHNSESVPMHDAARFHLLLHFWPFVAQIYQPVALVDGKERFVGFAIAVPDVAELKGFCDALPDVMRRRGIQMRGYRPADSIVDIPIQSGVELILGLRNRIEAREANRGTVDLVLGVDVLHFEKRGNNVVLLGSGRIEPEPTMLDEYERVRRAFWNPLFRRQRMANVLSRRPWLYGFTQLIAKNPFELTIGSYSFCRDARFALNTDQYEDLMSDEQGTPVPDLEPLVYGFIGAYVARRVESKYGLRWAEVQNSSSQRREYGEKREKVAKDAFLAVRSRNNPDFVDYFTSTLASVPQFLKPEQFVILARALQDRPEDVRALTLLALSAHSWTSKSPTERSE